MGQLVLVPASAYNNKCLNSQTVTKPELPKYQVEQNPTYQIDSSENEINKIFLPKQAFQSINFSHSDSQTLILDSLETGVVLSAFAQ